MKKKESHMKIYGELNDPWKKNKFEIYSKSIWFNQNRNANIIINKVYKIAYVVFDKLCR